MDIAEAYLSLTEVYYFLHYRFLVIFAALRSVNAADRSGVWSLRGRAYAVFGTGLGIMGLHKLAIYYLVAARRALRHVESSAVRGNVLKYIMVYSLGIGNWSVVLSIVSTMIPIFRGFGDRLQYAQARGAQAKALQWQGKFSRSLSVESRLCRVAKKYDQYQPMMWGLVWTAVNHVYKGDIVTARPFLEEALEKMSVQCDDPTCLAAYGLKGFIDTISGAPPDEVIESLNLAQHACRKGTPNTFFSFDGLSLLCHSSILLFERERQALTLAQLKTLCKKLLRFSAYLPVGKPRAYTLYADYLWLSGSKKRAVKYWAHGVNTAKKMGMKFEEGLAHFEWSRHLPDGNLQKDISLNKAVQLFEGCGSKFFIFNHIASLESVT